MALPARMAWQPKCKAIIPDEHAVSTVMHGPCKLYTYESLEAITVVLRPVAVNVVSSPWSVPVNPL